MHAHTCSVYVSMSEERGEGEKMSDKDTKTDLAKRKACRAGDDTKC